MIEQVFKAADRVRLVRAPEKVGKVLAVTSKGAALVVVRDRGQCKGDYMRYPLDWWVKVG